MTKIMLIRLITTLLVDKFDITNLKAIRSLMNQGALLNIFEHAVDKAIETKEAENFQSKVLLPED